MKKEKQRIVVTVVKKPGEAAPVEATDEDKKNKGGRPSLYSPDMASLICALLAEGKSLTSICALDNMPRYSTVMGWLWQKSEYQTEFSEMYARAREMQAERLADEITDIADDGTNDYGFKEKEDGKEGASAMPFFIGENVQRSKLRVESRKWIASKLLPKKYGEKITQEITGKDGGPVQFSDTERAAKLQHLIALATERARGQQPK